VSGQWNIKVSATSTPDKDSFLPVTCDQPALTAACNQPPLSGDNKDKLKVELQLKDKKLKTIDNLAPKSLLVRACYTKASATDRPWRRANNVIDVSVLYCSYTLCCPALSCSALLEAVYISSWAVSANCQGWLALHQLSITN
jgi:hypothetical protein